jgi:hypothetical protein
MQSQTKRKRNFKKCPTARKKTMKNLASNRLKNHGRQGSTGGNSTYPKGGVSCSKDSFVVNQTLVFQINFCSESPALRVAANRQAVKKVIFF